jgi:hypothetical protein
MNKTTDRIISSFIALAVGYISGFTLILKSEGGTMKMDPLSEQEF